MKKYHKTYGELTILEVHPFHSFCQLKNGYLVFILSDELSNEMERPEGKRAPIVYFNCVGV